MSLEERQHHIDHFQHHAASRIIVLTMNVGATGINLTAGSQMLFVELPRLPSTLQQTLARASRLSQRRASTCATYLIANNTLDVPHWQDLNQKLQIISTTLDTAPNDALPGIEPEV